MLDFLTCREAEAMASILSGLDRHQCARRLLQRIDEEGGITRKSKDLLFEARFLWKLIRSGIEPEYEAPGVDRSKIDFAFVSQGQRWRVELMRLADTRASREATRTTTGDDGTEMAEFMLSSDADDQRQSEEGETLKVVERICQKCERSGRPHKFPPVNGAYHVLLVDSRTFIIGCADEHDIAQIGLGAERVWPLYRRYWNDKPIAGVFSPRNDMRGAREARERLHAVGFVVEKTYEAEEFATATRFIANPHLLSSEGEVSGMMQSWPLRPAKVLNSRVLPY